MNQVAKTKSIILVAIALTLLLLSVTVVLANPHKDYAVTTNKCKTCHKVHDAPGTYKLLNATNAENACDYCHAPGGQTLKIVYTVTNPVSDHAKGAALSGTPITSKTLTGFLYCFTCHSVHGANALDVYILKKDPANDGVPAGNYNQFCADCHDKATAPNSHVMTSASRTAWQGSNNCTSCHAEPGGPGGDFPHTSTSHDFLGQGRVGTVTATALDNACLKCHWDPTGNLGVGKTY